MTSPCFTVGIYENQWVYVRLLALEVQKLVKNHTLDRAHILWYKLRSPKFLDWLDAVEKKRSHMHPSPFGDCPYILEITGKKDEIPGLEFTGQFDIPRSRVKKKPEPGCFGEECDVYSRPLPNFIVVDHHLFDLDTTGLAKGTSGHAPIILEGLRAYCGDNSQPPPILVSSQKSLAGETGQDTLGFGRGKGSRVSWIPRPQEEPTEPPPGFAKVLQEEVGLWLRNRDVLGVVSEKGDWRRYDPPFDHILISYDRVLELDQNSFKPSAKLLFRDQKLSPDDSDAVIARHCKAYLEVNKRVTQDDINRLQRLASEYPLPIVLLYWNTNPNVGNLLDCGVLAELVEGSDNLDLANRIHEKAVAWTKRMAALDTVVGSKRLVEIRDDLLNWRLAGQSARQPIDERKSNRQGLLVVGRTGVGKTGISRWCHFFSTHFKANDEFIDGLLKDIMVPNPALKQNDKFDGSLLVTLKEGLASEEAKKTTNSLKTWLTNTIRERGAMVPDGTPLRDLVGIAFGKENPAPLQVNLVGITTHREFTMQIAGAFPSWTGSRGAGDWRPGAVLNATNNSLILNEIGELKGDAQGLLLELIERDGPIRPLFAPIGGEVKARNVLFIMATDRVDRIREQLLHRCRVFRVPSLLECQQDLPELARHRLLPRWCCLSERAEQFLKDWPYWPGNHRSLHAVLDFAAERLPSERRIIRVQDLIRALWREDLFRIPSRLEILIKWILDWPDLDQESPGSTLPGAITRLSSKSAEEWKRLADNFKRIAKTVFDNPSAHFTNLISFDESSSPEDNQKVVETAVGLLIHEAFLILEKRIDDLQRAIDKGKEARIEKLTEIVGSDFERELVNELREDALVVLSLGTLLWDVLDVKTAELSKIETLIQLRQLKASGRKVKRISEENIEESDQLVPLSNSEGNQQDKLNNKLPKIDSRISTVKFTAGAVSLPVIKALDSPQNRSFFDYVEDRRNRMYFSRQRNKD